ncbi:hypothetical protein ABPG72_015262 [Tetrahymena utriculariae]
MKASSKQFVSSKLLYSKHMFLKGYTVQQLLGQGGFGREYKTHHFKNDKPVAIIVIMPNPHNSANEDVNKTFLDIINCQKLNSQYVVKIEKPLLDKETWLIFIIQEYCSKGNLSSYIKTIGKTENYLKDIFIQILRGFFAIHDQNIIHSDLKSDNILVSNNDVVKIADFGEAKQFSVEKGLTHTDVQGFTALYAAPELILKKQKLISKESDYQAIQESYCFSTEYYDIRTQKRASCQRILNFLQKQNDLHSYQSKQQIQYMTTECNEEALSLLINYSTQRSIQNTKNQQPLNRPLTQKYNYKNLVIHSLIEIVTKVFYIYLMMIAYVALSYPYPCGELYVCSDKFDLREQGHFYFLGSNNQQIRKICDLNEPQRKEAIQQYFHSKYNQGMTIQYYEQSYGIAPYFYLGASGIMALWILFRILVNFCQWCRK